MWYIVLSIIVCIVTCIIVWMKSDSYDRGFNVTMAALLSLFGSLLMAFIVLPFTTGLYERYSEGERMGYITKMSTKGMIYKTVECEMQVGTGSMAALQGLYHFSIPPANQALIDSAYALQGVKVKVKYREWMMQPFEDGSSGYEAYEITRLDSL